LDDLGAPSSHLVLEPGTAVYTTEGEKIGEVQHVLADDEENVFDGIVIDASALPGWSAIRGRCAGCAHLRARCRPRPDRRRGRAASGAERESRILEVTGVEDVDRTELGEKLRRAWEVVSGKGPGRGLIEAGARGGGCLDIGG
jgi:hypothetical protein